MQALCQLEAQGDAFLERLPTWLADADEAQGTVSYAQQLVERAWRDREITAAELKPHTGEWAVDRLSRVDRNVLRVALAEFDVAEAPPKVIINEAIEIADAFGGHESSRFVNGVLDAAWKNSPHYHEPRGE